MNRSFAVCFALAAAACLASMPSLAAGTPSGKQEAKSTSKSSSSKASSSKSSSKKPDSKQSKREKEREKERRRKEADKKGPPVPDRTEPRVVENPDDPREQRIAELRQRLESLVHDNPLGRTRLGVAVLNARDGDVLYAHNIDKLFNPASNTKILTTAAAIEKLGGDYRYPTRLVGPAPDEDGIIKGDVELRGSGDPSLTFQGLGELARNLRERAVTRIEGDLLADGKYRDPAHPEEALGSGALIVNKNTYTVRVRPGEPKHNAVVTIEPPAHEYFVVDNSCTTVPGKRTRLKLDGYKEGGKFHVVVKGRINTKTDFKEKERIGDGSGYALAVMKRALADYGIELTGKSRSGGLPGDANVLAEHQSVPLGEVCRVSNKDSNNFVADQIFKTLGRACFGGAATMDKGKKAVLEWLAPLGLPSSSWKIVNGSGLTHENRVDPLGLAQLLRHLYLDLPVAPEFVTSLAIGGIDGTIKGRFGGSMVGRVRAKTGTLSNVSALSGYVGDKGDVLVFAILVDDFHRKKLEDIRIAQARMVREMMAFLRADKPQTAPGVETQDIPEKTPIETDDETDESESEDEGGEGGN